MRQLKSTNRRRRQKHSDTVSLDESPAPESLSHCCSIADNSSYLLLFSFTKKILAWTQNGSSSLSLHCALSLAAQCIAIGPVCNGRAGSVCLCVCLWVCYHDNSKLRASVFTKLWPREGGLPRGEICWLRLYIQRFFIVSFLSLLLLYFLSCLAHPVVFVRRGRAHPDVRYMAKIAEYCRRWRLKPSAPKNSVKRISSAQQEPWPGIEHQFERTAVNS